MTSWYVQASGGSDTNGGSSWATRSTDTDGVTNGTNTFTSAAAKFVAGDVGHAIFIGGVSVRRLITGFTSATSITFSGATIASGSSRTWTIGGRLQTIGQVTGIPSGVMAAGDTVYLAPGTFKELITLALSGGNTYATGTISLTNGSATVTGSGTTFTGNAFATNGFLKQSVLASGTDGVANGTTTFTSAAGNFQSSMIGKFIQVTTKAAYQITAVGSATSITLSGSPSAGSGLTYSVMTGEPPYQIASVDSNTQLTLSRNWDGPTVTGVAYLTYQAIVWVGDYLGTNTDGVGGQVRVTGAAANEQTASRAQAIIAAGKSYNHFSGLLLDSGSSQCVQLNTGCTHIWFDKCYFGGLPGGLAAIQVQDASQSNTTVSNSFLTATASNLINFTHSSAISDTAHVVQNCILHGNGVGGGINSQRIGGVTVTNCTLWGSRSGVIIQTALTVGQCVGVFNSIIVGCNTGLSATATSEIMEDYNQLDNSTNRTNTGAGSHSNAFIVNFDSRWFFQMAYAGAGPNSPFQVLSAFDVASFSPVIDTAGLYPPAKDTRGTPAQTTRDWGALEYDSTLKVQGGPNAQARFQIGI